MAPGLNNAAVATTIDAFFNGRLIIEQPARGYRAGLDAILLATATTPAPTEYILDIGAGVGTVGLALAVRVPGTRATLVEREPSLVALAQQNIARNDLGSSTVCIVGDVTQPLTRLTQLAHRRESYDRAVMNPPYFDEGRGTRSSDPVKDASHAMAEDTFDDWARFAATMLRPGGELNVIHRAEALPEILQALSTRFGAVRLTMIYPSDSKPANRIFVSAIKASRAPLTITPPLIVHETDGTYTLKVQSALRESECWR